MRLILPSLLLGIGQIFAKATAGLCFLTAIMLSAEPIVSASPVPGPTEVRLGRGAASDLLKVLAADGMPRGVYLTRAQINAMATLTSHGLGWVRLHPLIDSDRLRLDASLRAGAKSWLNVTISAIPDTGRKPIIGLRIGHVPVPNFLVTSAAKAVSMFARWRGFDLPMPDALIRELAVAPGAVWATLAVPQDTMKAARELFGAEGQIQIDPTLVGRIYGRLLASEVSHPMATFADRLHVAFRSSGSDPVVYNRAAFVALAMATVGPEAGRLAGLEPLSAPCSIEPPRLFLRGRSDLPKHFALSAALVAVTGSQMTRALGEWKELDDSLPGGSGFSFIDLMADRAAMHLGRAATSDPMTATRIASLLATADDETLLPPPIGLVEGMSDTTFARRYGSLGAARYRDAVRQIDAMLRSMPLYRDIVP